MTVEKSLVANKPVTDDKNNVKPIVTKIAHVSEKEASQEKVTEIAHVIVEEAGKAKGPY